MSNDVVETWRSEIRGRMGVIRLGPDGSQSTELIRGGKQFVISPVERKATQAKAAEGLDPFLNGQFAAVKLIETDEDYAALQTAGALTDAEIDDLVDGNFLVAKKAVAEITSIYTLRHLLDVADEKGASSKRLQLFRDRLSELGEATVGTNAGPGRPEITDLGSGPPDGGIPAPQMAPMTPQDPHPAPPITAPLRG
jgi:hypothetical protein